MNLQKHTASGIGSAPSRGRDSELVLEAIRGSRTAFESLMQRYHRLIWKIVLRCSNSLDDTEDIVQQTFMKAFVNLPQFEGKSSFSTWLVSIARNEALMWRRKRSRRREQAIPEIVDQDGNLMLLDFPEPAPNPETLCLQKESTELLLKCMRLLSPRNQVAIQLCDLHELTGAEVALQLGIGASALKTRKFRGRTELRKHLSRVLLPRARARSVAG